MFQKKIHKESTEVLVVGAGLVGLWAAVLLSEREIPFKILDREWRSGEHNYALTLHSSTLKLFDELGLLDEVLQYGRRIDTVSLYDGSTHQAAVDFSKISTGYPFLVVLSQPFLEGLFERKIKNLGGQILWNHSLLDLEVGGNSVRATVEKLGWVSSGYSMASYEREIEGNVEIEAKYVIGADGYESSVRRLLDIPFDKVGKSELFMVIDFETDVEMGSEARITLTQARRSVLWPLPERRCRGIFQMDPNEVKATETHSGVQHVVQIGRKTYPRVPDDIALHLLKTGAPSFTGEVVQMDWPIVARFEQRLARTFGKNPVCLCGDSARVTGPIGSRSTNAGFAEAYDLVSRISQIRDGGALSQLRHYGQKHLTEWKRLFAGGESILGGGQVSPWVMAHRERLVADLPASGSELVELLTQLDLKFENSDDERLAHAV